MGFDGCSQEDQLSRCKASCFKEKLVLWNHYDMYRHDYSRSNTAKVSGATNLYSASYFVINSDFRVYACLQNGTTPDTPNGKPSLDEPTFTDLEPRSAGTSGDGYIWKYLYSIKPVRL